MAKKSRRNYQTGAQKNNVFGAIIASILVIGILSAIPLGYVFRKEIAQGFDSVVGLFKPSEEQPGEETPEGEQPGKETPEGEQPGEETLQTCNQMIMQQGAYISLDTDYETTPLMRFECVLENSLVEEVSNDPNKKVGIVVASLDDFNEVNENNLACIDWIKKFEKAGKEPRVFESTEFSKYNEMYCSMYGYYLVSPLDMNKRYVAWGYLADSSSGETVYQYAMLPEGKTYRDTARSAAYLASGSMNKFNMGGSSMTDEQYNLLRGYVDFAVDSANGVNPVLDGSMPSVITPDGNAIKMCVGDSRKINFQIQPEGLDLCVYYRSKDETVAAVNESGEITALNVGATAIEVYVAGMPYQFTVEVIECEHEEYEESVCLECGHACEHPEQSVWWKGKSPTCTEEGYTDVLTCDICGEATQCQESIPALGHDFVDGVCTRCGNSE